MPRLQPHPAYCDDTSGHRQFKYSPEKKIHILDRLAWSEMFESFLANKFAAAKRFGLEVRTCYLHLCFLLHLSWAIGAGASLQPCVQA